jgi:hypothetical protein
MAATPKTAPPIPWILLCRRLFGETDRAREPVFTDSGGSVGSAIGTIRDHWSHFDGCAVFKARVALGNVRRFLKTVRYNEPVTSDRFLGFWPHRTCSKPATSIRGGPDAPSQPLLSHKSTADPMELLRVYNNLL